MKLPDIQKEEKPQVECPIQMVGITGEKRLVHFNSKYQAKIGENPDFEMYCDISVFTDLSRYIKGTHMSRLVEVIGKHLQETHSSIEGFAQDLAKSTFSSLFDIGLTQTIVKVSGDLTVEKFTPASHLPSQETLKVHAKAIFNGNDSQCEIGVTVPVLLVCPCAQELVKQRVKETLLSEKIDQNIVNRICELIPMASHNQRGYASVFIELPSGAAVDFREIAKIVHGRLNQIYSVLKREDELEVVYQAHLNPTFVEDACRELAKGVYETFYERLNPESKMKIIVVSKESIHQHDAFAKIEVSFEQFNNVINSKSQSS